MKAREAAVVIKKYINSLP